MTRTFRNSLEPQRGHLVGAGFDLLWRVLAFCFALVAVGALLVN